MDRSAKILLAGSLMTAGIATALLFRHPATRVNSPELPPAEQFMAGHPVPSPTAQQATGVSSAWATEAGPAALPPAIKPIDPVEPPPSLAPSYLPPHPAGSTGAILPQLRAEPSTSDPAPAVRTHRIVDGDTLPDLAARYLGSRDRYLEIYEANRGRLASPDLLPIGLELIIPPANRPDQPTSPPLVPVPQGASAQAGAPSPPRGSSDS